MEREFTVVTEIYPSVVAQHVRILPANCTNICKVIVEFYGNVEGNLSKYNMFPLYTATVELIAMYFIFNAPDGCTDIILFSAFKMFPSTFLLDFLCK